MKVTDLSLHLPVGERERVRGVGPKLVRTPSPGSLRSPPSPHGRGKEKARRGKVTVRPAVAADFAKFIERPLPYRVRALAGVSGGEVIAVGGIAYMPGGAHAAFLMAGDKARGYPLALHRTALQVLQDAKRRGITPLVTVADPAIGAAERWLRRLGFTPMTIDQQQVWVWQE